MIDSKLCDHIQKELDSYFPFPSDQQLVAMVCDSIMLTLALSWLYVAEYKDDIDNAKSSSSLLSLTRPPKHDVMPNVLLDDDDIDVQVCDDDDVFGMVKHPARTSRSERAPLSTRQRRVIWRMRPSRSGSR
ncbi:unnamed protein product [Sphagnum balticum]